MPEVSREGDTLSTGHGCTGETVLDIPTQSKVFIENKLVARVGDPTVSHSHNPPLCPDHVANVNVGSSKVIIVNSPVARVGDSTDDGEMTSGSAKVIIGG